MIATSDQTKKRRNASSSGAPIFIDKLEAMLQSRQYADLVSWSHDGTAFVIKNVAAFTDKVLPAFFKHHNLSSFIRQLNMYNFGKVRSDEGEQVYANQFFTRDNKANYHLIRRRATNESTENEGIVALKCSNGRTALSKVQSRELQEIAQKQRDMQLVCLRLFKENKNMIAQNSRMWRKLSKRLEKKDRRVEKLLCYLLLGNNQTVLENGTETEGALQAARPKNLMLYNDESEGDSSDSSENFGEEEPLDDHDGLRGNLNKYNQNGKKGLYPMIEKGNGATKLKKLIEMLLEQNNGGKKKKNNFTIVDQGGFNNHSLPCEQLALEKPVENLCIKEHGESLSNSPKRIQEAPPSPPHSPTYHPTDNSIISDVNLFLNEESHPDDQDWFKLSNEN